MARAEQGHGAPLVAESVAVPVFRAVLVPSDPMSTVTTVVLVPTVEVIDIDLADDKACHVPVVPLVNVPLVTVKRTS